MHITFSHHKLLVYLKFDSIYHLELQNELQRIKYENTHYGLLIDSAIDSYSKEKILTWLYQQYIQDVPITLEHFKSMLFSYTNKPIEVRFVNSVNDAKAESLEIKVTVWGQKTLILKPSFHYERLYKYLKLLFNEVSRNDEKEYFELMLLNSGDIEVFERFLTRKMLIKQRVHFIYDAKALDNFFYMIEEEEEKVAQLEDSYMLLDLEQDATFEELKNSYRELAKSCHPDLAPIDDGEMIEEKTAKFQDLQEAYEQVKNSLLAS
jgi:hypothetical protein